MPHDVRAVLYVVGVSEMSISLYSIRGYISRRDRTKFPELTLNDTGNFCQICISKKFYWSVLHLDFTCDLPFTRIHRMYLKYDMTISEHAIISD